MLLAKKANKSFTPVFSHLIFIIFCVFCIIPIILVLNTSFTAENVIVTEGYSFIPKSLNLSAYEYIFKNADQILDSYLVTISVTAVGTVLSLLFNSMIAYSLSRRDFILRNKISFYVFFTMLFSGGLVPWYVVITSLKLKDTFLVLVIPYLVAAWYILMFRTFFQSIHIAIIESAKIDGSSEFGIYFKIILPLSIPVLATMCLFTAFAYWNDYWLSLLFISDRKLMSIQFTFYKIMENLNFYTQYASNLPLGVSLDKLPKESARMALCILTAAPMLFIFPFFQKYFLRGLMVGSIKG